MISRRNLFGGLAGLGLPALAGCGGTPPKGSGFDHAAATSRHAVPGLDAVIDISHNVTVTDFAAVRRSNILAVIHKVSEGDWIDPSYATRRRQAEAAGLLWGGYHFGTRQYSGAEQAATFLSACQPGPATVMALDLEPNERKPANTMRLAQAEEFVLAVQRATGRLPLVYTHPAWANGERIWPPPPQPGSAGDAGLPPVALRPVAGRLSGDSRKFPMPGRTGAGGSGSTPPMRPQPISPMAVSPVPSPASAIATATCLPAIPPDFTASGTARPERHEGKMDLKGKVAVVTGGNGGLGQRICHALAREGCHIAVVYAQSKDQADGVARDLEKHQVGGRRLRLRRDPARPGAASGRRRGEALRPARHPDQRRRLQQIDPLHRPRRPHLRGMDEDHRHQPHRTDAAAPRPWARS